MRMKRPDSLFVLLLFALAGACATGSASNTSLCSNDNNDETAPAVYDALQEANTLADGKPAQLDAAIDRLDDVINACARRMADLDKAKVYELRGRLKAKALDRDGAIRDLQAALNTGALPFKQENGARALIATMQYSDPAEVDISGYVLNPDKDAQPLVRIPPRFPEECLESASIRETVLLRFDITPDGQTENIKVVETSNACFNEAAKQAIASWKYEPKIVDYEPKWRRGMRVTMTFERPSAD